MKGRYGPYGGQYVPETLMSALAELEAAWAGAREDPEFQLELAAQAHAFVGRPTPLYAADRLTEHFGGAEIHLKREDLCHTGAHKLNNALGQGLLARRMGKRPDHSRDRRRPARGRHRDRLRPFSASSAWSTWAGRTCAGSR